MKREVPQIDPALWLRLNIEAKHRGLAVSELLLEALHQFLGLPSTQSLAEKPSDFDRLAGTWTQEEAAEFERNTAAFDNIDPAMWE